MTLPFSSGMRKKKKVYDSSELLGLEESISGVGFLRTGGGVSVVETRFSANDLVKTKGKRRQSVAKCAVYLQVPDFSTDNGEGNVKTEGQQTGGAGPGMVSSCV